MANQTAPPSRKKSKKKSTNRILTQMEFYFSDSNLRRDRFLREKIGECMPQMVAGEDPESAERRVGVDLSIFLQFNNIKAITDDVTVIRDSLAGSSLLDTFPVQAEEGLAHWYVARKDWEGLDGLTDFLQALDGSNKEFDSRTVYCENLPINASQQWLRKIFAQFGKINLVSVPRFKGNQRIKQFCFVEFADEATLPSVLDYFRQFNGVLCYDETESNHLQSIQKFHEENQQNEEQKVPPRDKGAKRRKKNSQLPEEVEEKQAEEEQEGEEDAAQTQKAVSAELNDNMIYDLKIMPKVDWKRLRNKYLNLQREMVREMKKQAFLRRMHSGQPHVKRKPLPPPPQPAAQSTTALPEDKPSTDDGVAAAPQSKRRKRGREKVKEAIKKGSHIFFDS